MKRGAALLFALASFATLAGAQGEAVTFPGDGVELGCTNPVARNQAIARTTAWVQARDR